MADAAKIGAIIATMTSDFLNTNNLLRGITSIRRMTRYGMSADDDATIGGRTARMIEEILILSRRNR
jgi:hypothetical protein